MMASDHTGLHHTVQEDKTSGQCRNRRSSNNSPGRLRSKVLPKEKPQQKNTFLTGRTITAQEKKNKMACHLLPATDHTVKELKNEVAVLRNKVETFTTENRILKRHQSLHLTAIRKYKNAEINLPNLLATHSNEMQTLKANLRKSQEKEHKISKKLREVQVEHLKTMAALQSLQNLCEDRKNEEREELQRKLRSCTQKLEATDKKTQDLKKQLASDTASFRHKLAVEEKNIIEAQSTRENLKVELESLKLKLKERERELNITNIYAHRKYKSQPEKADSGSSPKVVKVNKAVQANISLKPATLRRPECYVSPMIFHEELKINREVKEVVNIAVKRVPETGVHLPEILPVHNISNRTLMGFQSEEICPRVEKNTQDENIESHKNRRERQGLDRLNAEFDILKIKRIEKQEKKEDKEAKEAVCDILTIATPSTSKKHYVFSEAIQNLHQGYPSTGPKIRHSTRQRNRQQDGKTNLCPEKTHDEV